MSHLLKKLTRRLLKGLGTLLPLLFVAPAMAQWGPVATVKEDTSRFISDAFINGLIMPHQQVIVGLLDTTITSAAIGGGNASKIIVGSLLDHEDNCANYTIVNGVASCAGSYEKWRELEKSTSWYQADRGDTTAMFPTNYAITVSTGSDSVKVWNRDTAESWMVFVEAGTNIIRNTAVVSDINFKDGLLYIGDNYTAQSVIIVDFLVDRAVYYQTTGLHVVTGNIQERNGSPGNMLLASSPAIVNNIVNAVAAVRDPFGLTDGIGRPKHWWIAGTGGGNSFYNPHTDAIYDSGETENMAAVAVLANGSWGNIRDTTNDQVTWDRSLFVRFADGRGFDMQRSADGQNNALELIAAMTVITDVALSESGSYVGENAPMEYNASTAGAYRFSQLPSDKYQNARQLFNSSVNAPVGFGDAVLTLALEDNTTDSSPYANTMTANNSPGTATAVFGNGYSSTVGSYLSKFADSDFNLGTADWYVAVWMKSHSATDPSAAERVWSLNYAPDGAHTYQVDLHIGTDGSLGLRIWDDGGSSTDQINPTPDFYDGLWHHVVVTRGGANFHMYVDGVNIGSTAVSSAAGVINTDDLTIGGYWNGAGTFTGFFDDFSMGKSEMTAYMAAQVHAEGRKKLGIPSAVFSVATSHNALLSNNVVDIDALDNGIWAVVFSDAATAQVFDGRIPLQEIAAPAGTVKSVALIQSPGADSVGVAIGTTTNLKFVQPSVNLRAAMAHQYQEPIHVGTPVVVDSAGLGGIFWAMDDAVDAAANAKRGQIRVMHGTYGCWDADQNDMVISCDSPKVSMTVATLSMGVVFTNGSVVDQPLDLTGYEITVENCGFYTETGGGGGGQSAIKVEGGGRFTLANNVIIDSDAHGMDINSSQGNIIGNYIQDADANGIYINEHGDLARINGNFIGNVAGNSITLETNAENNICVGNWADVAINDGSGTSNCSSTHNEID